MPRRPIFSLALALLLVTPVSLCADPVDDLISGQMQSQNIPGLSLAVVRHGKVVKAAGYGLADRRRRTPAIPDTVYRIASVSKQFIAAGVMLLAQEGRIGVDDPIIRYVKDAPATWHRITIRHLLTHTSGLVRESPNFDPGRADSDVEIVSSTYALPLRFEPGAKWEYGNVGYSVLAELITVASGRPWTEYIRDRVLEPLAMRSTYPTNTTEPIPNRAVGYTDNNELKPVEEWLALGPSGGYLSTVLDLAKWDAALYTTRF
jgi:CubicO group peptidase (beta-lactamase class C family)